MNQKIAREDRAKHKVTVVGAGLAGLSAGCALAEAGFKVTLLERRPYIGGRASSYQHPGTGEIVDNCQHVLLGCCTNLLDLYDRFGAADKIRWFDSLTFVEPGGRRSVIHPSPLPAPFHTAPSFLVAASLGFADKIAISRAMLAMMSALPEDTTEDFLSWLKRHGQTPNAIDRFWKVVLVSALNEDLDRTSVRYAAQVFRESFMKSAGAGRMGVPTVPLTELYSAGADYITKRGGTVRLRSSVDSIALQPGNVKIVSGIDSFVSDYAVLAVPYHTLGKMLPPGETSEILSKSLAKFESSPITGIHLWFDREISDLEHAVLLDRTIQWMFHKSKLLARHTNNGNRPASGSYVELVVSSSKSLVDSPRGEIIELALKELAEFFPAVAEAKLVKSTVIKEIYATYSALPQSDFYRPNAITAWPNIFLAGDWTATGWPATMEGAVRSGYKAAEALTQSLQMDDKFLVADLPASGLMRLFD
ncbi:MAG: Carotene 7,8-desaturase [Acidobacteriaceae bacterium]|nr:Carotene 7,8-desaturase [Acidobacteriaceae bacterium]